MRYIIIILAVLYTNFALANNDASKQVHDAAHKPVVEAEAGNKNINEFAEILAGLKGNPDHVNEMNQLWDRYKSANLARLEEWQKKEIEGSYKEKCTVFYPFSGPDVVHVLSFFPKCSKFFLVGLEAPGNKLNPTVSEVDFPNLRKGIHSLLNRSFFVTREMWSDFQQSKNGLFLPILALLKRMDANIVSIEKVYIDSNGNLSTKPTNTSGLKVKFIRNKEIGEQEIYYFKASITNANLVVHKFLDNQKEVVTYLKAAQYTLYSPEFAKMREAILKKSAMILQDDSGIPFRYFSLNQWDRNLYGKYIGPYGESFKGYKQPDLMKYEGSLKERKPLPFYLGYGYKRTSPFLMKMIRKNDVIPQVAAPVTKAATTQVKVSIAEKPVATTTPTPVAAKPVEAKVENKPLTNNK
jgi:hypothetical protein